MVTCKLYGRLGNQMFQIAASLGYAFDHGRNFVMPRSTLNPIVWPNYFESLFPEKPQYDWMFDTYYKEKSHEYNEIPRFKIGVGIVLDGYFQSWKYFDEYRDEILTAFEFNEIEKITGVCSIHVRRGDYLKYQTKHPVVTEDYLLKAIDLIRIKTGINKFMVFSDDFAWCRDFFEDKAIWGPYSKRPGNTFMFSGMPEIEDMKLMASCEHNIISNSTFSWWGAYMNNNPDKMVVTPHEDNWFGPDNKHLNVSDLLPVSWNRIKF